MIRTRDLVLFIAALGFLLVAIAVTVSRQSTTSAVDAPEVSFMQSPDTFTVVGSEDVSDREGFIRSLRNRIGFFTTPEPEIVMEDSATTTTESSASLACQDSFRFPLVAAWETKDISVTLEEGARVVSELIRLPSGQLGTSSSSSVPRVSRNVLFFVSERAQPAAQPTCVSDSVIGFTAQGALIDIADGSQFTQGGNELVGYAFDGFPLYGRTTAPLDACNGQIVSGQYRYHLPPAGDLQSCFKGTPIEIKG